MVGFLVFEFLLRERDPGDPPSRAKVALGTSDFRCRPLALIGKVSVTQIRKTFKYIIYYI